MSIGPFEIVLIGLVAVMLFGGDLPLMMRKTGQALGRLRRLSSDLSRMIDDAADETERLASPRTPLEPDSRAGDRQPQGARDAQGAASPAEDARDEDAPADAPAEDAPAEAAPAEDARAEVAPAEDVRAEVAWTEGAWAEDAAAPPGPEGARAADDEGSPAAASPAREAAPRSVRAEPERGALREGDTQASRRPS